MKNAKPISIPLASAMDSPKSKAGVDYMSWVPYSNAIGCLMYTMVCTRPDIA